MTEDDLPVFFEQQRDPDANRMAAFPARDHEAFFAHWAKILADPTLTVRAVLLNGQLAGNIGCWKQSGKRLVGYWIGKEYWGKGVASRALAEFLRQMPARPLYAHVAKHNTASIRVLEKCGFTICDEEPERSDAPSDGVEEHLYQLRSRAMTIREALPADHDALLDIWLRSVRATHTFLTEADIQSLLPVVRDAALPALELWVLCADEAPVGFMGLSGSAVEALFLAPEWSGRGGGRMMIEHARRLKGSLTVDVNEQNPEALRFYEACGFVVVGRSEVDSAGRPFPLLHLRERSA